MVHFGIGYTFIIFTMTFLRLSSTIVVSLSRWSEENKTHHEPDYIWLLFNDEIFVYTCKTSLNISQWPKENGENDKQSYT